MRFIARLLIPLVLLAALAVGVAYWFAPAALLDAEIARQAWMAGVEKRSVDASGHHWVYYEGGEGPTVLLLHGFAGSKENWLPAARYLTDTHHVIIPDLPGWGETSRVADNDYGVRAQVKRLRAWIGALGLPNAHIVGHSMGGHIAGLYAARHPTRTASLVLVETAGVRFPPNAFARRVLSGETPFNYGSREELDAFFADLFQQTPRLPPRIKDALIERSQLSHGFQSQLLDSIGRGDEAFVLEGELGNIKSPTQIVWCNGDKLLDKSSIEVLTKALPRAQVAMLYGCSHMPMIEQPSALAAPMLEFWAALP